MESERTIDGFREMEKGDLISELCDTRAALRGRNEELAALEAKNAFLRILRGISNPGGTQSLGAP